HHHPQVASQVRERPHAQVLADTAEEHALHPADDANVVLARDRQVRPALEEALYLEIVVCADDAAPRHGGQCLDEAQDVRLGESRENSEMEQRGTKAAARQREADLPAVAREGGLGVVAQQGGQVSRDEPSRGIPTCWSLARLTSCLKVLCCSHSDGRCWRAYASHRPASA